MPLKGKDPQRKDFHRGKCKRDDRRASVYVYSNGAVGSQRALLSYKAHESRTSESEGYLTGDHLIPSQVAPEFQEKQAIFPVAARSARGGISGG